MVLLFYVPVYLPKVFSDVVFNALGTLRVMSPRKGCSRHDSSHDEDIKVKSFLRFNLPINIVTAPLIAVLFLSALSTVGQGKVHDDIPGANGFIPLDVVAVFLALGYIANSVGVH